MLNYSDVRTKCVFFRLVLNQNNINLNDRNSIKMYDGSRIDLFIGNPTGLIGCYVCRKGRNVRVQMHLVLTDSVDEDVNMVRPVSVQTNKDCASCIVALMQKCWR